MAMNGPGTMAGESPTVVECPYHRNIDGGKIAEQDRVIQVEPVDVMQMDQIRLNLFNLPDQFLCRSTGSQSMAIEQERLCPMETMVEEIANLHDMRLAGVGIAPIGDITLPPLRHGLQANLFGNTPMGAPVGRHINL